MKRALILILAVAVIVAGLDVGESLADSVADYPDTSFSEAIFVGSGIAFVFWDVPGDKDLFIHSVDFLAFPQNVPFANTFGSGFWLDFEGFSGPFLQFGV